MGIEEIRRLKSEPKKKKEKKPIRPVAKKRQKQLDEYSKVRAIKLALNPLCEIFLPGCTIKATEVHHGEGRENEKLLDIEKMKSACRYCHNQVTEHSKEAIENGHSYSRLKKNDESISERNA